MTEINYPLIIQCFFLFTFVMSLIVLFYHDKDIKWKKPKDGCVNGKYCPGYVEDVEQFHKDQSERLEKKQRIQEAENKDEQEKEREFKDRLEESRKRMRKEKLVLADEE